MTTAAVSLSIKKGPFSYLYPAAWLLCTGVALTLLGVDGGEELVVAVNPEAEEEAAEVVEGVPNRTPSWDVSEDMRF